MSSMTQYFESAYIIRAMLIKATDSIKGRLDYEEEPMEILEGKYQVLHPKIIPLVKVL